MFLDSEADSSDSEGESNSYTSDTSDVSDSSDDRPRCRKRHYKRERSTSMEKENMILGVIRGREDMLGNQGTDQRGSVSQLVRSVFAVYSGLTCIIRLL